MTSTEATERMQDCRLLPEVLSSGALEQGTSVRTNGTQSDADLVAAVGTGDMCALGELVGRHQQKVLALAYRILGHWDLAEDIGQEVFLRVSRSARKYQSKSKVTTWLHRITVNLCLDSLRRAKRDPAAISANLRLSASSAPDPLEASERVTMVRQAVLDLPARQRTVLNLHRYQGLSHQEITEATGWSRSAVESLLVRAYANLRKSLSDLKER